MEPYFRDNESKDRLAVRFEMTVDEALARGLAIPEVFLKFMRSLELRERVPSCTACYFDAPDRLVDMGDGGVLFRFLNDQQWCVLWRLYLGSDGKQAVVESYQAFDLESAEFTPADFGDDPALWICAPDFETFLFRFWLENNTWFAENDAYRALTDLEKQYLERR